MLLESSRSRSICCRTRAACHHRRLSSGRRDAERGHRGPAREGEEPRFAGTHGSLRLRSAGRCSDRVGLEVGRPPAPDLASPAARSSFTGGRVSPPIVGRVVVLCSTEEVKNGFLDEHPDATVVVAPMIDTSHEQVAAVADDLIAAAHATDAEFCVVCLGHPKDPMIALAAVDSWPADRLPPLFLCLGASAELYLGLKKRAPNGPSVTASSGWFGSSRNPGACSADTSWLCLPPASTHRIAIRSRTKYRWNMRRGSWRNRTNHSRP